MMPNNKLVAIAEFQVPQRSKSGRPPYQRDERTARQVEAMAGFGIPLANVAKVVGVSENTMRKYYPDEIALGATKANAKVIESLFRKATGERQGAVAAAIFWVKARCGWRETNVQEVSHTIMTKEQRDAVVAAALGADS